MELPVIKTGKYIKIFLAASCLLCVSFVVLSCKYRADHQTEKDKITVHENNENGAAKNLPGDTIITEDSTALFLNSLDIRLVLLNDSIFIGSPSTIDMKIINNSNYTVLTGNAFVIKRLEFGFWAALPEFEKRIWTDEGYLIAPKTEKLFVAELDLFEINLEKEKYIIEKEVSIYEKEEKSQIDSNSTILGKRSLKAGFVVK